MKEKKEEYEKVKYNNKYIKEKLDRINFTAPKGYKDKIQKRAEELGYSKPGPYIKHLIDHDINQGGGI